MWRYGRSPRFFLPVKALSLLFRAKFRDGLKQAGCFEQLPPSVWTQDWVVHSLPVGRGKRALKYLAAYVFRVALSNKRLVALTADSVTFRFRPSGSKETRLCSLSPFEFVRRFLQHVLPKGFVKVRYYGFFSPAQRSILRQIVAWFLPPKSAQQPPTKQIEPEKAKTDWLPSCPHCGLPLRLLQKLLPLKPRWQPP